MNTSTHQSADSQPNPLVDDVLRKAINDLSDMQPDYGILVLKEGLPPAGGKFLTSDIDGLREVTATVLAITQLDRKQSSVSFSVPGPSATEGEGLRGEIEWDSVGSFVFDTPLALAMPTVEIPNEPEEPLIINWQHATILGVGASQPGEEMRNVTLKLYPPPETTWKSCRECFDGETVPQGCKYPICIKGVGCFCPFG